LFLEEDEEGRKKTVKTTTNYFSFFFTKIKNKIKTPASKIPPSSTAPSRSIQPGQRVGLHDRRR